MVCTVAIPSLIGLAVDAAHGGHESRLRSYALAIAGAGVTRLVFNVFRRIVSGRVSLGVELDLRETLYAHMLGLELGFFDRQQTGQLMSRATVDLQAVRIFLATD